MDKFEIWWENYSKVILILKSPNEISVAKQAAQAAWNAGSNLNYQQGHHDGYQEGYDDGVADNSGVWK